MLQPAKGVSWRVISREPCELIILHELSDGSCRVYVVNDSAALAAWETSCEQCSPSITQEFLDLGLLEGSSAQASPLVAESQYCKLLDLDACYNREMVALGTFLGGTANLTGSQSCAALKGGIANGLTGGACRPPVSRGLFNSAPQGPQCA